MHLPEDTTTFLGEGVLVVQALGSAKTSPSSLGYRHLCHLIEDLNSVCVGTCCDITLCVCSGGAGVSYSLCSMWPLSACRDQAGHGTRGGAAGAVSQPREWAGPCWNYWPGQLHTHLALLCPALAFSCLTLPCLAVSCLAVLLPCPFLSCPAPPCPSLLTALSTAYCADR